MMPRAAATLLLLAAVDGFQRPQPRARAAPLRADFWGAFPSGAANAYDKALMCLSLESDEQYCSIEVMEDAFRALDDEMVRGECSPAHEAQIDELWRIIKLCYGGATRREAILARRDILAAAGASDAAATSRAYRVVLRFLDPRTSSAAGCSEEALEQALAALDCEGEECLALNEGELQVLEQLRKVVGRVRSGYGVQRAVEATWGERETAARSRLTEK
jgi:hypothetical protein